MACAVASFSGVAVSLGKQFAACAHHHGAKWTIAARACRAGPDDGLAQVGAVGVVDGRGVVKTGRACRHERGHGGSPSMVGGVLSLCNAGLSARPPLWCM